MFEKYKDLVIGLLLGIVVGQLPAKAWTESVLDPKWTVDHKIQKLDDVVTFLLRQEEEDRENIAVLRSK